LYSNFQHNEKLILFLIITYSLITINNTSAQKYYPFPDSNVIWIGRHWYQPGGAPCIVNEDYNLYISGDTTVGSYTYHILYQNMNKWSLCTPPGSYNYYGEYWGAFRQDSMNKKVYLSYNGADALAYDFNLKVGDTLPTTYLNNGFMNYVQSIDSVLIDNEYHKIFWLNEDKYAALIEGIGSTLGAFAPLVPVFESGNDLWCVRINNKIVWTYSQDSNCGLTTIPEESVAEEQITIYPNPATENITIDITRQGMKKTEISITNITGQEIYRTTTAGQQKTVISTRDFPEGIYFARIKSPTLSTTRKFIVTK